MNDQSPTTQISEITNHKSLKPVKIKSVKSQITELLSENQIGEITKWHHHPVVLTARVSRAPPPPAAKRRRRMGPAYPAAPRAGPPAGAVSR